jgi:antitoxin component of RelBE/YafQ-DinJ toxin-antitoxin module
MDVANVQEIKVDAALYEECRAIFEPMYITVEDAIEIFLTHASIVKKFPFEVTPYEIMQSESQELMHKYAYKDANRVLNKLLSPNSEEENKK